MAKPLTSWLVPSFSQHNLRLVVSEFRDVIYTFKWRSFRINLHVYGQVNSPNSWEKFQICCADMYLIRFLPNFAVFCLFLWISRPCDGAKYQKPCLRAASYTQIYIWRLHFSSWSPKADLRIFLISSPVTAGFVTCNNPFNVWWWWWWTLFMCRCI